MPPLPGPERRRLGLLIAWAAVLFSCGLWWGLPNDFTWAGDELHPSTWPQAINPRTINGWHTRYPPLHFALLQGLSAPLRFAAGHQWFDSKHLLTVLMVFSRLTSLAMALVTLWLLYRAAREVLDERAALWTVFILASVAPYVYYAKMANLDAPYVMWFTLSLWMFLRILREHRMRDYVVFAAAAAAAVCTKDQAYGLYSLAPLPILISLWQRDYREQRYGLLRAALDRRLWAAALTAGVLFVFFQDLLFDPRRFLLHIRLLRGPMSENYQDYAGTPLGQWDLLKSLAGLLRFALNPALFAVCLAGLGWTIWRLRSRTAGDDTRRLAATGMILVSYYATFLVLILFCYDRYVLPMTVVLALFGGAALGALTRPDGRLRGPRLALAAAIAAYSVLYAATVDFRLLAETRYQVEDWVAAHAQHPETVIAIGRHHHIARFRWVRWERALENDGKAIRNWQPEMITVNLTDLRAPEEIAFVERLTNGELGYKLAVQLQGKPLVDLIPGNPDSSQRFINPEVAIFQRVAPLDPASPPAPAAAENPEPE